jgi:hypothetical protein
MTARHVIQRKRGRPPGRRIDYDPIMSLRMPVALRAEVEAWAAGQDDKLSVSKAICHLVEMALKSERNRAK